MPDVARRTIDLVGATNVEFRKGNLESMPFQAVLQEVFRLLKPRGRLRIADIVWTKTPTQVEKGELASWTGCVAALEAAEYVPILTAVGFVAVELGLRQVAEKGYTSAYVRAAQPRRTIARPRSEDWHLLIGARCGDPYPLAMPSLLSWPSKHAHG